MLCFPKVLAQLFWIAVSVLESDYEYEFILAMRLLDKVLARLPLDRPDCRDKVSVCDWAWLRQGGYKTVRQMCEEIRIR